jgi:hypothetical protein
MPSGSIICFSLSLRHAELAVRCQTNRLDAKNDSRSASNRRVAQRLLSTYRRIPPPLPAPPSSVTTIRDADFRTWRDAAEVAPAA